VALTSPDIVVNGISGAAGFLPSVEAIRQGALLALANKESLVIGGPFIADMLKESGSTIVPVDSEHSAVFQCLNGEERRDAARIILTASGGPFRTRPKETFGTITPAEALSHPTWSMGRRITIDSATMMNKGLEIIEAYWLFGVELEKIEVVVHPQSIVHSLVEFRDRSTKAQLSLPDMRLAIAYALSWPGRMELDLAPLDLASLGRLEFFAPDSEKFPALALAREAMEQPRVLPCVMNAADEVAIEGFLKGRIPFDRIVTVISKTMDKLAGSRVDSPAELIELDIKSRTIAETLLS
jgi:1-deoxy-D-xylulose-5-phosphate reductoisomerase